MLRTETVEPGTFSLLRELCSIEQLSDFCLVGGTALSLRFGHRKSIDLDLFSHKSFDYHSVLSVLNFHFKHRVNIHRSREKVGVFCTIDGVKVDLIKYDFPVLRPLEIIEGIPFYSNKDIAAMKIQAILGRGAKKGYWDIALLLDVFTITDFISLHQEKYPSQYLAISIPSAMLYFADAEDSESPVSLNGNNWIDVKAKIRERVDEYLKN